MKNRIMTTVFAGLMTASLFCSAATAQDAPADPGHPRVSEVDQRLQNQQNRINAGVADGQITPTQAGHDEKRDARVEQQAARDEAKHGGHLTKREQRKLNHELNKNSKHIHHQRADGAK